MNQTPDTFPHRLNQKPCSVYLVYGEEPLQHSEAVDQIRSYLRSEGFVQREVFHAGSGFNWDEFALSARALPLLSGKRLLQLGFPGDNVDRAGSAALLEYLKQPPAETVLLVTLTKLASKARSSAWYRGIDKHGQIVRVRPIPRNQFSGWLRNRIRGKGMSISSRGLSLLASRVEGNLLAAAQEINKLHILNDGGEITVEDVDALVVDSALYDVYQLVDSVLAGDVARSDRILKLLQSRATPAAVVLWALARELRSLQSMRFDLEQGLPAAGVLRNHRVWDSRKALIGGALKRCSLETLQRLLCCCASVDQCIKGVAGGDPWSGLRELCFMGAGMTPPDPGVFAAAGSDGLPA